MAQIEVISGVERRRRWTLEEKQAHVARAFALGVNVRDYTRREKIVPSTLYKWRQELMATSDSKAGFMRVKALTDQAAVFSGSLELASKAVSSRELLASGQAIEIESYGQKIRVPESIPPSLAAAVIQALVRR